MSLVRFRPEAPYADLAHLVERHLAKVEVAGSSPVIRSTETVEQTVFFLFISERCSNEFPSSRIVASCRLRKSTARLAPCFVEHRSAEQHSVVLSSLTRNPLQKKTVEKTVFFLFFFEFNVNQRRTFFNVKLLYKLF